MKIHRCIAALCLLTCPLDQLAVLIRALNKLGRSQITAQGSMGRITPQTMLGQTLGQNRTLA